MTSTLRSEEKARVGARDRGRVLLVADDPSVGAYSAPLEAAGFNVVAVARGAQALVEINRARPHLVVVDEGLKGVTADELARKLSAGPDDLPLVQVGVAQATVARRSDALALGAFDYFQLPEELALLVARVAQLIKLRLAMDRLRAEANRDYLTGLANRRRFRGAFGQELERWRRYRLPCALLLVDIDHLKKINDAHGHTAGDRVIRHVADALTEFSRDNDTAARLGGEEFALLLAGADGAKALAAAERLREAVGGAEVEGVGTATVSIGVAACPAHAQNERTLYAAADAALYRAKREGRNRSALAPINL